MYSVKLKFCGDIRDPNGTRLAMEGIDVVYHLAALIAIPEQRDHSPDNYVDVNIKGTLNVLQAARLLKTKRILITSTSEVYESQSMFLLMSYTHFKDNHPTAQQK